jgi:hypothetical protein
MKSAAPWLLASMLLGSGVALAQDVDEEAKTAFMQGVELYDAGKHEQAAVAFETAYKLKPSFKILFNIAQVENELGHFAAALEAYTRYLAEGGDEVPAERLEAVKAEIKRLNALVGMIVVECPVDGAKVKVDNEAQGKTPLGGPIFVDLGKHEVVVKHGQQELLSEVIKVGGGETVTVVVETDAGTGSAGAGDDEDEPARVWTWVAFGVGAAAGITGGVLGGVSMSKKKELDKDCVDTHCPAGSQGEIDTITKLNLTADVLYGVAAVGVVAGIVLAIFEPDWTAEEKITVGPTAMGDGAGLLVGGRF